MYFDNSTVYGGVRLKPASTIIIIYVTNHPIISTTRGVLRISVYFNITMNDVLVYTGAAEDGSSEMT